MNKTRLHEPTEADNINKLRTEVKWYSDELTRLDREYSDARRRCEVVETTYLNKVDALERAENEL